ncbi:unnamed protein product [Symbiodinium necroappetens]|uniref:Uncharacterized protein n=1 Tax=Symbiodinium necroappetens TaxID=1628268 RepID=A0A812JI97_9DINO|nr:unnamed protein product [Symbiodinium necroappetens]
MGGKKWADGRALPSSQPSAPWRSSTNAKWNWWPGTWSPRRQPQEVRYDQMEVSHAPDYRNEGPEDAAPTFHQALQKSLTTARKLDGKLRKIASEKERRHKQWQKYEDQAKKTFLKNRKNYEADIAKLDKEAQETVEAGQIAAAQVKALAIKGIAPAPTAEPMEVEAAWETLWRNAEAPPSGASFLQEALDASANLGIPRNAQSPGPPGLNIQPPPQQTQFGQMPPNDVSSLGPTEEELRILRKYWDSPLANPVEVQPRMRPGAMSAPPQSAIAATALGGPPAEHPAGPHVPLGYTGASPDQRVHRSAPYPPASPLPSMPTRSEENAATEMPMHAGPPPVPHAPKSVRAPIKEATKHLPAKPQNAGVPLQEKLEQKRDQLKGTATQPFRLPPEHSASISDTGDPPQQRANLIDDDKEAVTSFVTPQPAPHFMLYSCTGVTLVSGDFMPSIATLPAVYDESHFEAYGEFLDPPVLRICVLIPGRQNIILRLLSAEGGAPSVLAQAKQQVASLRSVVVFDLSAIGGPLFADIVWYEPPIPECTSWDKWLIAREDGASLLKSKKVKGIVAVAARDTGPVEVGFTFVAKTLELTVPQAFMQQSRVARSTLLTSHLSTLMLLPLLKAFGFSFLHLIGDLTQVLEYGASIPPALDLGDLMFVGDHWVADPPLAFSSSFSHYWVLHEGGARGIDADFHAINSAYGFQEFAADALQFAQHRHCIHIEGGSRTVRKGVMFLQADDRSVLVISYVEQTDTGLVADPTTHSADSDSSTDSTSGHDEGDPDDVMREAHSAIRSRSPRHNRTRRRNRGHRGGAGPAAPISAVAINKLGVLTTPPKQIATAVNWIELHSLFCGDLHSSFAPPGRVSKELYPPAAEGTACKILVEPNGGSASREVIIAHLRYVAPRLGFPWRHMSPINALRIDDGSDSDSDEDVLPSPPVRVCFRIIVPGFDAERVEVSLVFPTTLAEVIPLVQDARCRTRVQSFPRLIPASPQPLIGDGVFIACPAWSVEVATSRRQVCIDCSALDGRIYSALVPPYFYGANIPGLVNLPSNLEYSVFAGPYGDLLQWDSQCHLVDGDTIFVCPEDSASPTVVPLHVALLDRQHWIRQPRVPEPRSHGICCVVFGADNILHINTRGQRANFRAQLAASVGVPQRSMRITSSSPRVLNAAIDGFSCRSVIVVSEGAPLGDPTMHWVLLDARALFLGWRGLPAPHGQISCRSVIDGLLREIGSGWRLWLRDVPFSMDLLDTREGQGVTRPLIATLATKGTTTSLTMVIRTPQTLHLMLQLQPGLLLLQFEYPSFVRCTHSPVAVMYISETSHGLCLRIALSAPAMETWSLYVRELPALLLSKYRVRDSIEPDMTLLRIPAYLTAILPCKCKYIEEQLHSRAVNVACLQETKLDSGTITSQYYVRLHSRADSHWGVAVWVHKQLGVLCLDGEPLHVDEHDVAVLHECPRLIVLLITKGQLKIGLISGHCPHSNRPGERDEFLAAIAPLLQRLKHVHFVLGGVDLNGRIPPNYQGVSGSLEFGEADATGWSFASILADSGLWVPSLFSQLHCGDSATYTHPSGKQHRIDYNLLGGQAVLEKVRSEVDCTFDNGSPQDDHMLLDKLMTSEGRECLRQKLPSFRHPGWDVSPDQHCREIEQHISRILDTHFSVPRSQKKASYIPERVWRLRERKLAFKQRVRYRSKLWHDLVCRAFHQWKECQDYGVVFLLEKQSRLYELAAVAVQLVTRVIKREISLAKSEFLHKIACEGHQGAAKILQRVKQAGVGGTKARPISRPLPMLLHPSTGSAVTTRQQRDEVWMLHFGKQEQGQAIPISTFLQEATYSCYQPDMKWTADMLPTYADVERVLRAIPRNKAAGLDNIPGEVLKAVPAETARLLLPLFLKSMVLQHQPIQWRGGVLFEAFKRSGLQSSVDNYRSLFVSSYLAKAYHRVVRDKTQAFCRDEMHSLHLGSKKRAPVTFASMYVLAHLRRGCALRRSVSVLYLDTSAAYYRIVRELAVGDIRDDHTVIRLFKCFGLSGDDLHDLLETVESGGMLAQAGAPDALRQVVKDIHLHTWFVSRFSDGTQVCSSLAGSRPGESWADLIYAYISGRVLSKIHEFAVAEDLTFTVTHDPTAGVFPPQDGHDLLAATDATWADDSAFPLIADDPESLMRQTCRLCTLVISFCEGHGMAPNLKPGKTSVMISLQGKKFVTDLRRPLPGTP